MENKIYNMDSPYMSLTAKYDDDFVFKQDKHKKRERRKKCLIGLIVFACVLLFSLLFASILYSWKVSGDLTSIKETVETLENKNQSSSTSFYKDNSVSNSENNDQVKGSDKIKQETITIQDEIDIDADVGTDLETIEGNKDKSIDYTDHVKIDEIDNIKKLTNDREAGLDKSSNKFDIESILDEVEGVEDVLDSEEKESYDSEDYNDNGNDYDDDDFDDDEYDDDDYDDDKNYEDDDDDYDDDDYDDDDYNDDWDAEDDVDDLNDNDNDSDDDEDDYDVYDTDNDDSEVVDKVDNDISSTSDDSDIGDFSGDFSGDENWYSGDSSDSF